MCGGAPAPRAGCRRRELSIAYHRLTGPGNKPKRGKAAEWDAALTALAPVADECARHKVDWRGEALGHRATGTALRSLAAVWRHGSAAGDDRTAADCAGELEALLAGPA